MKFLGKKVKDELLNYALISFSSKVNCQIRTG